MPYDKKLYFCCGCITSLLLDLHDPIYGLSTGIVVGVCTQIEDYIDYGLCDKYDMLAAWAGAVIGTFLCLITQI